MESSDIWLSTSQVAELEGKTIRAVQKKVNSGFYAIRISKARGGKSGESYEINLNSLSAAARNNYYKSHAKDTQEEPEDGLEGPYQEEHGVPLNLAELEALVGREKFRRMLAEAEKRAEVVREYLELKAEYGWGDIGKAAGMIEEKYGVKKKTLYRMEERYKQYGIAGLVRKLPTLNRGTRRRIDRELELFFRKHWLQLSKPTVGNVMTLMSRYCKKNGLEMLKKDTIYRLAKDIETKEPDLYCLGRRGEDAYIKEFMEKAVRQDPKFVNQIWEGDHHKLDFFGMYNKKPYRFWVTAWEDVASRVITGFTVAIQANGQTIGLSMRHGVLEKQLPVWSEDVSPAMKAALDSMQWELEDLNQRAMEDSLPFTGLPMALYIDNGEDYKAKVKKGIKCPGWDYSVEVKGMCGILNVEPMFCTPYSPYAKGHLERLFQTLCMQFSKNMPGYCGGDNKDRPETLKEKKLAEQGLLLTLEEIYFLLSHWVWEYHNTVHSSLGMTPLQKYEEAMKARTEMPDPRTMDIAMMDVSTATVFASGIRKFSVGWRRTWYKDSDGVLTSKYVKKKVVVRYDPANIGELLVFDMETGSYVCTATNRHYLAWGTSKEDVAEHRKRGNSRKKALKQVLKDIRDGSELEKITEERRQSGERMISGSTRDTRGDVTMITGLEKAAAKRKEEKVVRLEPEKRKISVFEEVILSKAGRL